MLQNGTTYHNETPPEVINILETARVSCASLMGDRLKLFYGDSKTGRAWGIVERCYIGRSAGQIKVPLVISRSDSTGGNAISDNCIVRIESSAGGKVRYSHKKYHVPEGMQIMT